MKVRIIWNGQGGELDSVIVADDGEQSLTKALAKLIENQIVSVGDSFVIEAVE